MRLIGCIVLALLLASCGPSAPGPAPTYPPIVPTGIGAPTAGNISLPLDASSCREPADYTNCWYQEYLPGTKVIRPVSVAGCPVGALCEMLPDASTGQLASYLLQTQPQQYTPHSTMPVYRDLSGYVGGKLVVHLRIKAPAGTVFHYDSLPENQGCGNPPAIRPYLHQNTNLRTERWFAVGPGGFYVLAPTDDTAINVPLTADRWVDVGGEPGTQHPAEFAAALADLRYIGLVMGGGCSYPHGIYADKPAELDVLSYQVVK